MPPRTPTINYGAFLRDINSTGRASKNKLFKIGGTMTAKQDRARRRSFTLYRIEGIIAQLKELVNEEAVIEADGINSLHKALGHVENANQQIRGLINVNPK
jgi:hypothetical protein